MIFLLGVPVIGALFFCFCGGSGKKLPAKSVRMLVVILFLSVFVIGAAQSQYRDDCRKIYPRPQIKFDHVDADGRVYIPVINWAVYDNQMFRQAPELPPCGLNTNSARTWVDIYDANTNARIYGFCAFGTNSNLQKIWFKPNTQSCRVYIILNDRACKRQYKSNIVSCSEHIAPDDCRKKYPNPQIKFDHVDADGRVYIPVLNWAIYDNQMFRQAPDLPPCGLNTKSARTWVDIYDANTNARIYGFCAFGTNSDLQKIWFKPNTKDCRVYIILNDRACKKQYKSNIVGCSQPVAQDDCRKIYPNPQIKFDHIDAQGRVYIPVINWAVYDNQMFRQAPELPPCGLNTKSARTWVDIYDAATNARIYGFCAFGSNSDLQKIWFKPNAKSGRVYIILDDRACKKKYKSNILPWP
jgi:uncharacterized protein (UPF0248 family)/glutaredoxin-related protein